MAKGARLATNRLDDQELAVLSLHLLQNCMVYINTLMLQQVLVDPAWRERMGEEERRGSDAAVLCPRQSVRRVQTRHVSAT